MTLAGQFEQSLAAATTTDDVARVADEIVRALLGATGATPMVQGAVLSRASATTVADALRPVLFAAVDQLSRRAPKRARAFAMLWASFEKQLGVQLAAWYLPAKAPGGTDVTIAPDVDEALSALAAVTRIVRNPGAGGNEIAAAKKDLRITIPHEILEFATAIDGFTASLDGNDMPVLEMLALDSWEVRDAEAGLPDRVVVAWTGSEGNAQWLACHVGASGELVWSDEGFVPRSASLAEVFRHAAIVAKSAVDGFPPGLPWVEFFEA